MKTRRQLQNVSSSIGKTASSGYHETLAPAVRGLLRGAVAAVLALTGLAAMAIAVPAYASGPATAALTRVVGPVACYLRAQTRPQDFGPSRMPWMYAERAVPLPVLGHRECRSGAPKP